MAVLEDGGIFLLFDRSRDAKNKERDRRSDDRFEDDERRNAVNPHHRGGGIAHDAPGTASVGSSHDRGEITDVHFRSEKLVRHRAPNERGRDVIEK